MYRNLSAIISISILSAACNNSPNVADQGGQVTMAQSVETFPDDTLPSMDTLPLTSPLDEATRLKLFKLVLKDVKTRKLNDFSALGNDRLLSTYRNFEKTFSSYMDSSDVRYTEFFGNLFEALQLHEQGISSPDTPDIRTRLEIARIKSDINDDLAFKKSGGINR